VRASISYGSQTERDFLSIAELEHQPGQTRNVESPQIVDMTALGLPDRQKNLPVREENGITYIAISRHLVLDEVLKVVESLGK
jgi:hypothetical protein